MKAGLALLVALLLVAPFASADERPSFQLVRAKMDTLFDGVELGELGGNPVGSHHRFTWTVRNEGASGGDLMALDAWWLVVDLPTSLWRGEPYVESGAERTFVLDVDGGFWFPPGPMWFCLRASSDSFPGDRCWSAFVGVGAPDGVYPEEIPHWALPGQPMGDME